jgi:NADPH:quinone reductase-like Zn-dependent oxidoreductase
VLKPNGRYVMIGGSKGKWLKPIDRVIAAMMYSKFVHQQMGMMLTRASKDDLALLARLMEQGKVTPVSRARGKVVIQME